MNPALKKFLNTSEGQKPNFILLINLFVMTMKVVIPSVAVTISHNDKVPFSLALLILFSFVVDYIIHCTL